MEVVIKPQSKKIISDGMLGMIFLLSVEVMLFAGFISAYIVNRAVAGEWPPADQPRLPVEVTAVNTLILLASGIAIFLFGKKFNSQKRSLLLLALTMLLGIAFVSIQGVEWVKLLGFGLTTSSSLYGAFFYTIIGAHALHTIAGLGILFYLFITLKKSKSFFEAKNKISVCSLYWYFVVGIWPVLYVLVYLN